MGLRCAGRKARGVFGPRLHLRPRPAERRAEAADEADGPLRVLPVLVARLEVARLRDVERRHPGLDPRCDGARGRLEGDHRQARPLLRAGLLARRIADRLPQVRRRLSRLDGLGGRSRALPGAGGRREVDAHHRGRRAAAVRQGERPGLLRQDRGRRGPGDSRQAHPRVDQARRLRAARVLHLGPRHRVRDLARRQVARLPRGLQRVRHAVRRDRPPRRHRAEEQGRSADPRLEGGRGVSALLRRLVAALLGLRARALRAGPEGGVRVPAGRAREAAAAGGAGAEHLLRRAGGHAAAPRARSPSPAAAP